MFVIAVVVDVVVSHAGAAAATFHDEGAESGEPPWGHAGGLSGGVNL